MIFFSDPNFKNGVRLYLNEINPFGRIPNECPLINTSLFLYTPSKSILICLPFSETGKLNDLQYQPNPPFKAAPPVVAGLCSSNFPSILQSCGKFNFRQLAFVLAGISKIADSVKLKNQSLLKSIRSLTLFCALTPN